MSYPIYLKSTQHAPCALRLLMKIEKSTLVNIYTRKIIFIMAAIYIYQALINISITRSWWRRAGPAPGSPSPAPPAQPTPRPRPHDSAWYAACVQSAGGRLEAATTTCVSHLLVTEDPSLVSDHVAEYAELTENSYMMMQSLISLKPIETKTTTQFSIDTHRPKCL